MRNVGSTANTPLNVASQLVAPPRRRGIITRRFEGDDRTCGTLINRIFSDSAGAKAFCVQCHCMSEGRRGSTSVSCHSAFVPDVVVEVGADVSCAVVSEKQWHGSKNGISNKGGETESRVFACSTYNCCPLQVEKPHAGAQKPSLSSSLARS